MDLFMKVLEWLGVNNRWIVTLSLIATAAITAFGVISKMRSGNKEIHSIKQVADVAPADIKNHINDAQSALKKSMTEDKVDLCNRLADINAKTDSMARDVRDIMKERPAAPVQQDQLLKQIVALYAQHDLDQKQIQELKAENLRMAQERLR